jgi:hypothetical protein
MKLSSAALLPETLIAQTLFPQRGSERNRPFFIIGRGARGVAFPASCGVWIEARWNPQATMAVNGSPVALTAVFGKE